MTTTLTNASLADAVDLFLSPEPTPTSAIRARSAPPAAPGALGAARPGPRVVVSLFEARDAAFEGQIDDAFDRLECGTR